MARRKSNPSLNPDIIRVVGLACIALLTAVFFVMSMGMLLRSTGIFIVRDIAFAADLGLMEIPELSRLKGQQIFDVDLARAEARVMLKYPQLSNLRVVRRFPNQIFVTALRREPFAQAAFEGGACVIDRNGFMIGAPSPEQRALALIQGLKNQRIFSGRAIEDENVRLGIEIITRFRQDRHLSGLGFKSVRVDDPARIVCVVVRDECGFQIILDKEHMLHGMKALSEMLARGGVDFEQVKYMDLRFEEPVIGQKKAKK